MHRNDPFDRVTGRGWVEPGEGEEGASRSPCVPLHHASHGPPPRAEEDLSPCSADPVFTPALKLRFLDELSRHGNVRVAAGRVGVSRSGLYLARRRDAAFAAGWRAALCLARDHAEAVLAERALEGVEEPVFFRGELIATRRRYDTRLLLAHLARLDQLCAAEDAATAADEDAAHVRFDRTLADLADLPEARAVPAATREAVCEKAEWHADTRGLSLRKCRAAAQAAGAAWDAGEAAVHRAVDAAVRAGAQAGQVAAAPPPAEFKSLRAGWSGPPEPCPLCPPPAAQGGTGQPRAGAAARRPSAPGRTDAFDPAPIGGGHYFPAKVPVFPDTCVDPPRC